MNYRKRTYYTDSQKALMWERWKAGWTLHQIGHLFDRAHTSIQTILSRTGGIRPPERRRSLAALSLGEREEISRALVTGESVRAIAARLGRAPSTVSRELQRNGSRDGYRAALRPAAPPGRGRLDPSNGRYQRLWRVTDVGRKAPCEARLPAMGFVKLRSAPRSQARRQPRSPNTEPCFLAWCDPVIAAQL